MAFKVEYVRRDIHDSVVAENIALKSRVLQLEVQIAVGKAIKEANAEIAGYDETPANLLRKAYSAVMSSNMAYPVGMKLCQILNEHFGGVAFTR